MLRPVTSALNAIVCAVAAAAGCASATPQSLRVIATLRAGAAIDDAHAFEREVERRTGVRVVYGAAVSARTHALTILCAAGDCECEDARGRLRASDLFVDVSPDRRQRHR